MKLQTTSRRYTRIIELRDAALAIVKNRGTWKGASGMKFLYASMGSIRILHRGRFQRLPETPSQVKYLAALHGLPVRDNLPNGLDIWATGNGKVFNLEWDEKGNLELVGHRRGIWEDELLLGAARCNSAA
jgi:hypothetical protein